MAHLLRAVPDSILVRGYVTTGADLARIDEKTFVAINGDAGGTWSPSSIIMIGGKGVGVAGLWIMQDAAVNVTTAVNKPIEFGEGSKTDYFGLDAGHTFEYPTVYNGFYDYFSSTPRGVVFGTSLYGTGIFPDFPGSRFFTTLAVYSGSPSITQVSVLWRVSQSHANVPQNLPRMRVIAVSDTGVVIPLRLPDSTTDINGFQYLATPASGAAYYNGGAPQVWFYTCNVVLPVDDSKYAYYIEFIDESGANTWTSAPNQYMAANVYHDLTPILNGRN